MALRTSRGMVRADFSDLKLSDLLAGLLPGAEEAVLRKLRRAYPQSRSIVPTSLGREALALGLEACGVPRGGRVALPAIICPTVINTLLTYGYQPVVVDVGPDLQISPAAVAEAGPDLAAVVAAHIYCIAADMDALEDVAGRLGVVLVDDAAQAFGACGPNGAPLGGRGHFGILSFGPYKNLASSRGGALLLHGGQALQPALQAESAWAGPRRLAGVYVKTRLGPDFFRRNAANAEPGAAQTAPAQTAAQSFAAAETAPALHALHGAEAGALRSLLGRSGRAMRQRAKHLACLAECLQPLLEKWNARLIGRPDRPCRRTPLLFADTAARDAWNAALKRAGAVTEDIYTPLHRLAPYVAFAGQTTYAADDYWRRASLLPVPGGKRDLARLMKALGSLA